MKHKLNLLLYLKISLLLVFLISGCSKKELIETDELQEEADAIGGEEVLFIGNSHTYFNQGIPRHLTKFRANDNLKLTPLIQEQARGGYTLQNHLSDQGTLDIIAERSWDIIVLQENTFVAEEMRIETIDAMISISEMVKQKGTKVFLFMTWPYEGEEGMLAGIKKTYQDGALATGAKLVTVGLDWQKIDSNEEVQVDLYAPDGIHPSLEGTFFASSMFYKAIYGTPPSNNTYTAGLGEEVANYLKTKAN